ncbi:twin transmembrane helix small protein [Zavarzinia compransoris]|uniref:Twin transmembrane helix small protein n=1 Tax=Zavarzinia compransoris TaxID=1264899 RepID=A0A317E5Y2_9PROT|nr:twin transmembrane helix small protein [Zavarzinia compransoris]PWR22417.1 twin transmembrane helix small protein [Zavarzinia compransoris]TDP45344.1 hypoxia induced protein [Zavarzinia compransoris]
MSALLSFLVPLAFVALIVILVLGVLTLLRGGADRRFSNKLMQLRVFVQGIALVLLLLTLYLAGK